MRDERVVLRRNSVAAADARPRSDPDGRSAFVLSSSSSSSNSSSGGRFSSSESESTSARGGAKARSLCCDAPWPKPIRTRASVRSDTSPPPPRHPPPSSSSSDARFSLVKTKAKALRIYDDLKKVKQPISPGNRLASFLNSLLASKNSRKSKISSSLKQCDESAEVSTTGDGYEDVAPAEESKSGSAWRNAKASYGVVLERKSKYGYENTSQKASASTNEGIYKDAISFSQSKLISSSDALKNAKISSSVGRLAGDGVFERKSNPECGHEPAFPPLSRSRSGPSDSVPYSSGDRSVSSFAKIRSVRFNLPEEDEAAAAAAPTRARGEDDVAEAVREIMTRLKKRSDQSETGGSVVARDRNAEEDDGYSSSDLFELDNLTYIGHY